MTALQISLTALAVYLAVPPLTLLVILIGCALEKRNG